MSSWVPLRCFCLYGRVRGGDQPVTAAALAEGRCGVALRERRDRVRELLAERVEVSRRRERELGLDGEREQALALAVGRLAHAGDVADERGSGADQVLRRVAILRVTSPWRCALHQRRIEHERV